jgi:hypothetical protein
MSARPGRITDVIEVDLLRPRGVETRRSAAIQARDGRSRGAPPGGADGPTPGQVGGLRPIEAMIDRARAEADQVSGTLAVQGGQPAGSQPLSPVAPPIAFYLPAIVVFVVTIAVWEVLVSNIQIVFPLPAPSQIVEALGANWGAGRWRFRRQRPRRSSKRSAGSPSGRQPASSWRC